MIKHPQYGLLYSIDDLVIAGIRYHTIQVGKAKHPARWHQVEVDGINHFQFNKMTRSMKEVVERAFGHKQDIIHPVQSWTLPTVPKLSDEIKVDLNLIELISGEHPSLDRYRVADIARAASWLEFLSTAAPEDFGIESRMALYKEATQLIQLEQLHSLNISSTEYLRKKLAKFRKDGWRSLVPQNKGIKNAKKRTKEADEVLMALYGDPRRFSIAECTRVYNELASTTHGHLPELSESGIRSFLKTPKIKNRCLKTRFSNGEWRNVLDPVTQRARPSYADDLWVMDGTPFELYYRDGNSIKRLYWVWILDAASWKVVGYSVGKTETGHLVRRALRQATRATGTLPHQLQFDNGSAFKAKETLDWMKKLAKCTPAEVGNARAKVAEPFWAHFERAILKFYDNHSGGNIRAKRLETLANADFIKENWKQFPDEAGVIQQIHEAVALWNASRIKGEIPNEVYASGSPRLRPISVEQSQLLFWIKRDKMVKYTNRGLNITIEKEPYWFEAPAHGTANEIAEFYMDNIGKKFTVLCDPDDLSMVALYDGDSFVAMAEAPKKVPMAIVDHDEESHQNQAKRQTVRKKIREIATEESIDQLRAEEILKGAINHERLHKDPWNAAESSLKQLEAVGVIEYRQKPAGEPINLHGKATLRKLEDDEC